MVKRRSECKTREELIAYKNEIRSLAAAHDNEISPIPPVFNPARRKQAEADPVLWLRTYLPDVFFCDFTASQKRFINECWNAILTRSSKNVNAYRGWGKTSCLSGLLLMSQATGHTRHAIYLTAEGGNTCRSASEWFANALYAPYKATPEDCPPFCQDYPEITYPIQKRRGVAQKPVKHKNEPCDIVIGPERIQFPTILGSPSSGSLIRFASIGSSSIRGSHHSIRGEGSKRVDLVMLDDIQSDGTAKSGIEVTNIMETIKSTIKFLGGRTDDGGKQPLIILSALTQNQPDDVAVRIINEMPSLATEIIPFISAMPGDLGPWRDYREFRGNVLNKDKNNPDTARKKLSDYFRAHEKEIGPGVVTDNDLLREPWQVSALHYAVETWCESEKSFWCELQSDARRAAQEHDGRLSPIAVTRKTRLSPATNSTIRRCQIPTGTEIMTAFIDAGEHFLNYQVTAFGKNFGFAHVVDFGVWPDQGIPGTTKSSYRVDLQDKYTNGDKFDRLRDATIDCLRRIYSQPYYNESGKRIDINTPTAYRQHAFPAGSHPRYFPLLSVCGVDCGDGDMELALWNAIDTFHRLENGRWMGRAIATYGDESQSRLMRYYDLKPGEWRRERKAASNCDWIENPHRTHSLKRTYSNVYASLLYDSNIYKTRRDSAWRTSLDRPGSASLCYDPNENYLRDFAAHQCSEEPIEGWKSSVKYNRWRKKKPHYADNEFLDTDTGTWALASYGGMEFTSTEPEKRRLKVKW